MNITKNNNQSESTAHTHANALFKSNSPYVTMESKQKTSIITKMMNNGNGILQKTNIDPKVKVGGHFNTSLPPIHNSRHQIHSSLPLKLKRTSKEDILLKASVNKYYPLL